MQNKTETKSIVYSYPSSPNAVKYNHGDGCFLVEIPESGYVAGVFNNLRDAWKFALTLPEPFNRWTMKPEGETY